MEDLDDPDIAFKPLRKEIYKEKNVPFLALVKKLIVNFDICLAFLREHLQVCLQMAW